MKRGIAGNNIKGLVAPDFSLQGKYSDSTTIRSARPSSNSLPFYIMPGDISIPNTSASSLFKTFDKNMPFSHPVAS